MPIMCEKCFFPCKALIYQVKCFFKIENKFAFRWEALSSVRPREKLMCPETCLFFPAVLAGMIRNNISPDLFEEQVECHIVGN